MGKKDKEDAYRVSSDQEARIAPPPKENAVAPGIDHKVAGTPGLFVRVMKPDTKDRIRRLWVHRYDEHVPDGMGGLKKKNTKKSLGPVVAYDSSEKALTMEEAQLIVLNARAATSASKSDGRGGSPRLTIASVMQYYDADNDTHRDTTRDKDKKLIKRYFSHFQDRYLDELDYAHWLTFQNSLLHGKIRVGDRTLPDGTTAPKYVGPVKNATMHGIMTAAVKMYSMAKKFRGLRNVEAEYNPAREVKANLKVVHKKTRRIPLERLGLAVRASRQLCQPWWNDLFECYLLTGLRRSLMIDMRFDQIDWKRGTYLIDPRRPGTKRRGSRLPDDAPDIRLPLSRRVMEILRARREFAADKKGWVWYTSRAQRGIRTKTESRLADPRSSWRYVSEVIGDMHFGAQDLRRTFASLAGASASDLFAFSLMMLHSPVTVAKEAGVPGITIEYMNTNEAQDRMRKVAEEISAYLSKLEQDVDRKLKIEERELPADIEAALDAEAKEEADGEVEEDEDEAA